MAGIGLEVKATQHVECPLTQSLVGRGRVVPRWIALIEKLTHVNNFQPDRTARFRDIGPQSSKFRFSPFWSFFLFFIYIANAISKNSEIWCQGVFDRGKISDIEIFLNICLNDRKRAKY